MSKNVVKKPRQGWPKLLAGIIVTLIILIIGAVALVRNAYTNGIKPVSSSQKSQTIVIPLDSSVRKIGEILKGQGLIRSQWAFERYVRNTGAGQDLQAGTYDLRPSLTVPQIVTVLTNGKVSTNLVTILPAQRLDQIRSGLINSGFKPADVDAALNPSLYANHPALADKPASASLEGYLYPESFQKNSSTTPQEIIRQSLDQMQLHLTPAIREGFAHQGLSVHQGVTLASIVEKEVSKDSDRPIVAQVFLLRIKDGMVLGSDITALYGSILAGQTPSVTYDSPYNTHLYKGLPPGPVSNISASSLQAVANPSSTDWLYFVSGDDGTTYFSHTLQEHQALTAQHCHQLCNQ